ncbi:protein mono-ADP-ribosyltransferase TIPARP-like [Acipenser ruthenus]|uniref:protein mono-ADP-ribosyltransferase TIPARP-like n=1 Tax=Acipenser ruthenus TaxID=7906 RepID=UPI00274274E9|nr:protein mono-ADP-ribosyltransferase TIPARP-like [Acipenser ruthenus]
MADQAQTRQGTTAIHDLSVLPPPAPYDPASPTQFRQPTFPLRSPLSLPKQGVLDESRSCRRRRVWLRMLHRRVKQDRKQAFSQLSLGNCLILDSTVPVPGSPAPKPDPQPLTLPDSELVEQELSKAESAPPSLSGTPLDGEEGLTLEGVLDLLQQLQYHTHQQGGVSICPDFLGGRCPQGGQCPLHHTALPYHWQLRRKGTCRWESVGQEANDLLERLYCSPDHSYVTLRVRDQAATLSLDEMKVSRWQGGGGVVYDAARRLSTAPDPSREFHTQYRYYWRDGAGWEEYSKEFSATISSALSMNQPLVSLSSSLHCYFLSLKECFQLNVSTGRRRDLRVRPLFQSPAVLLPQLRTLSGSPSTGVPSAPLNPAESSPYPETWVPLDPSLYFQQVPLTLEDPAFRVVYQHFHKTMPESRYLLLGISRVQNPFLWDKYKCKKQHMSRRMSPEERLRNERHLFHGTSRSSIEAICKHNLDPRLSGKHAAIYGQGCYFARTAAYSHRYAPRDQQGEHHVFLCKVLVGRSAPGRPEMRRPPPIHPDDPASDLYNSCVDKLPEPALFVVFENDQCYPYFLIRYKELEPSVTVE